jgi:serine/threonine protein kinase
MERMRETPDSRAAAGPSVAAGSSLPRGDGTAASERVLPNSSGKNALETVEIRRQQRQTSVRHAPERVSPNSSGKNALETVEIHRRECQTSVRHALATASCVGPWELISLAAQGSWSQIHRARPAGADGEAAYALKILRPDRGDDPLAVAMLAREALVARSVSHPHVIAILEAHVRSDPRYLVMPWLSGATLEARLAAGPPIDLPAALWLVRQAAEGLEALDAAGWMHGDLKPANLFVSSEGHVTLLDLGFARRRDEVAAAVSPILGSGQYLAPEHVAATLCPDIRSDVYSLGVILYELLGGRAPLVGKSLAALAVEHKQTAPRSLRRLAPHIPPEAVELVQRMLAKDPLRRPQTPRDVVDALVKIEIATFSERA